MARATTSFYGAKTNLPPTGNEGDDWIEMGTQDGAPGDNFAPLLADDVIGNDIFVGGGGFDEMIGEGGDDIFVGSDAQDKMDGMSGFDWVTYKNDVSASRPTWTLAIFGGIGEIGDHIALPFAASPALDSRPLRGSRRSVGHGVHRHSARRQRRRGHDRQSWRRHRRCAHQSSR